MKNVFIRVLLILLVVQSCSKPNEPVEPPKAPGLVSGMINGKAWDPNEYYAEYYPKWNQVVIYAKFTDNLTRPDNVAFNLFAVIDLDSLSPLKSYPLEPNGGNTARLANYESDFSSGQNVADAGGSITLVKLDTLAKTLSCNVNFVSYNSDKTKRLELKGGTMKDITLVTDNTIYDGDYLQVDIGGAKNVTWKAKYFTTKSVNCSSYLKGPTLSIGVSTRVGSRVLQIDIPLFNGKGTFYMYPSYMPYAECGQPYNRSQYHIIDRERVFYSHAGTITISHLDLVKKELVATFNATYRFKDASVNAETFEVTNGVIRVHNWGGL